MCSKEIAERGNIIIYPSSETKMVNFNTNLTKKNVEYVDVKSVFSPISI